MFYVQFDKTFSTGNWEKAEDVKPTWHEQRVARLTAERDALREALTMIAEAAEENYADWVQDGYDSPDPIEYALATGKKAREALAALNQPDGE